MTGTIHARREKKQLFAKLAIENKLALHQFYCNQQIIIFPIFSDQKQTWNFGIFKNIRGFFYRITRFHGSHFRDTGWLDLPSTDSACNPFSILINSRHNKSRYLADTNHTNHWQLQTLRRGKAILSCQYKFTMLSRQDGYTLSAHAQQDARAACTRISAERWRYSRRDVILICIGCPAHWTLNFICMEFPRRDS